MDIIYDCFLYCAYCGKIIDLNEQETKTLKSIGFIFHRCEHSDCGMVFEAKLVPHTYQVNKLNEE